MKKIQKEHNLGVNGTGPYNRGQMVFYYGRDPMHGQNQKCVWFCVVTQDNSFPSVSITKLMAMYQNGSVRPLKIAYPAFLKQVTVKIDLLTPIGKFVGLSEDQEDTIYDLARQLYDRYKECDRRMDQRNSASKNKHMMFEKILSDVDKDSRLKMLMKILDKERQL